MRISKKAEYALRALLSIARTPTHQLHQIQELSRRESIPVKFLEQILLTLRHAGILSSKRGVKGGYFFARTPSSVTVGEVIRLMDGPLAPIPCAGLNTTEECTCPDKMTCPLRIFMIDVRIQMTALLDNRSIEDVLLMAPDSSGTEFMI